LNLITEAPLTTESVRVRIIRGELHRNRAAGLAPMMRRLNAGLVENARNVSTIGSDHT
jgi:hypothetical protein